MTAPQPAPAGWFRGVGLALAMVELIAAGFRQLQGGDSPPLAINLAAFICLALCATGFGRWLVYWPNWLVLGWLTLGAVRALMVFSPLPGWSLAQTISTREVSVTSRATAGSLEFQAGEAPAHLVNEFPMQAAPGSLEREQNLPLTIRASGFVTGTGTLSVASGVPVRVMLDGELLFDSHVPPDAGTGQIQTPNGLKSLGDIRDELQRAGFTGPWDAQSVALAYVRTALSGGWRIPVDAAGERSLQIEVDPQPVGKAALSVTSQGLAVTSAPTEPGLGWARRLLSRLRTPLDALALLATVLTALFWAWTAARHGGPGRALRIAVAAGAAAMPGAPFFVDWLTEHRKLVFMLPGDDWRTYESYSRDIREHSLLMLQGASLGHAAPLYFQPLYPYWLALLHTMAGESVQAVVVAQQVVVSVALAACVLALPPGRSYLFGLVFVCLTGIVTEWFRLAGFLLSENLLLLVFALLIACASRYQEEPNRLLQLLMGGLLGVGVLTRTTTWLAVPFVVLIISATRKTRITLQNTAFVLVPLAFVFLLLPIRNLVATGSAAPVPSSTAPFLYTALVPGAHYTDAPSSASAGLGGAAEAVLSHPVEVAQQRLRNAAYVLGFPRSLEANVPLVFTPLLLLWLLVPLGFVKRKPSIVGMTCLALALCHVTALVIIWPNSYYYRMVLPATLPLLVWDAYAIGNLVRVSMTHNFVLHAGEPGAARRPR